MRPALVILALAAAVLTSAPHACGQSDGGSTTSVSISTSAVGAEAQLLEEELRRFEAANPDLHVKRVYTPDDSNQRHQLYVQWLNAGVGEPDVLQLDTIWTAEFAAAGWIRALDGASLDAGDLLPNAVAAGRWEGGLYAVPWFVDVGLLYRRTDLAPAAPETFDDLRDVARAAIAGGAVPYGFIWQGARYEGLVCVFNEVVRAFGGSIMEGESVTVDAPPAIAALTAMTGWLYRDRITPESVLAWQEEDTRKHGFQNGKAVFLRSWPYALSLMSARDVSEVAGKIAVSPLPRGPAGARAGTLGGQQLAVNARAAEPEAAMRLIRFLLSPDELLERLRRLGQYPPRAVLYRDSRAAAALPVPAADVLRILEHAVPRPVTPLYAELSAILQISLHRALTRQQEPAEALREAAAGMKAVLDRARPKAAGPSSIAPLAAMLAVLTLGAVCLLLRSRRAPIERPPREPGAAAEARLAWVLMAPALACVLVVGAGPLMWTVYESFRLHDLRMPWMGSVFNGIDNMREMAGDERLRGAIVRTSAFAAISVPLELIAGTLLALALNSGAGRLGAVRSLVILPWALPTVVVGLLWRFFSPQEWLTRSPEAWMPIVIADVWKTSPFVALLVLAGLQSIPSDLYEAAALDGASRLQQLRHVTLPLVKPALTVALLFRTLDAIRVFDVVYVITGGGPGTATETLSIYSFDTLLQNLRFGYGSALSLVVFAATFILAVIPKVLFHREKPIRAATGNFAKIAKSAPCTLKFRAQAYTATFRDFRKIPASTPPRLSQRKTTFRMTASARLSPRRVSSRGLAMLRLAKVLSVLLVIAVPALPLAAMLAASLAPEGSLQAVPGRLTLDSYRNVISGYDFWRPVRTSLIVAGSTTVLCLIFGTGCAYAVARLRFRGKGLVLTLFLALGMFPQITIVPPLYLVLRSLGLINSYPGLVIPYCTFAMPLTVYLLVAYFKQLPRELEEAASVDGAGRLRTLFEIVLPLALPGVATTAILTFIYSWNELLFALSFTTTPERQTVPVAIMMFRGRYQIPWGEILAASVLAAVPIVALVLVFQRRIISGLTAGAVKG